MSKHFVHSQKSASYKTLLDALRDLNYKPCMSTFSLALLFLTIGANSWASMEGINPRALERYTVGSASRPCCNFALSTFTDLFGISRMASVDDLGTHRFAHPKNKKNSDEKSGLTFTCRAGFIDIAHVRDSADWTAHLMKIVEMNTGTGNEVEVHQEGGAKKVLFFPKLPFMKFLRSDRDVGLVARRIAYELGVWHEIATGFEAHVSTSFAKETSSAFSVEDNYSNMLGGIIGVKAYFDERPYEEAVTAILKETLEDYGAVSLEKTVLAHEMLEDVWWVKKFKPNKSVMLKKSMTTYGNLLPARHPQLEALGCPADTVLEMLKAPERRNFDTATYFQLRVTPNRKIRKIAEKVFGEERVVLVPQDFPAMIDALSTRFDTYLPADWKI